MTVPRIMATVMLALLPATALNLYLFGWPAIFLFIVTIGSCVVIEAICLSLTGQPVQRALTDNSAILTG
jgi:electron transport complex protein RnfD